MLTNNFNTRIKLVYNIILIYAEVSHEQNFIITAKATGRI